MTPYRCFRSKYLVGSRYFHECYNGLHIPAHSNANKNNLKSQLPSVTVSSEVPVHIFPRFFAILARRLFRYLPR